MFLDPLIDKATKALWNHSEAVEYLKGRCITEQEIQKFRIGYTVSPQLPLSKDKDFMEFMEVTRNLFFLKKRLLIPLENTLGCVNGVITRSLEIDTKYRYHQYLTQECSRVGAFFGLPQALPHILEKQRVHVVEGAMDCITLSKFYPNTVSTLTSDINEEQFWILRMLSPLIVVVFDPDASGKIGSQRVLDRYGNKGVVVRHFGHHDLNKSLVLLGEYRFKELLKKHLSTVLNFK